MFKWMYTFNYPYEAVHDAFLVEENKKIWNKTENEDSKIFDKKQDNNITTLKSYTFIKMPALVDNREMLTESTLIDNYTEEPLSSLLLMKSIDSPDYPRQRGTIRVEVKIAGSYLQKIDNKNCRMASVSHVDTKFGAKMKTMILQKIPMQYTEMIEKAKKYIKKNTKK